MINTVTDILEDICQFAEICEALEENEYWKQVKEPDMNIKNYFFSDVESIILDYANNKNPKTISNTHGKRDTEPIVVLIITKIKENSEIELEKELNISISEYASAVFEKIEQTACYLLAPKRLPY